MRLQVTHRHECNDRSDHPQTRGSRPHRSEGNHPQTRGRRASQKRGEVTHRRGEGEDVHHRSGVGSCTHRSGGRHHRSGVGSADWMHWCDLSQAGYTYMGHEECRLNDGEDRREEGGRRWRRKMRGSLTEARGDEREALTDARERREEEKGRADRDRL